MREYKYEYACADFYCYPNTNTLINKMQIKDNREYEPLIKVLDKVVSKK